LKCNKNLNEFTAEDEKHVKRILLTSLNLADKKVDISKGLMEMVDDNFFKLKMNLKGIEMAQVFKTTAIGKPKRMLKWTPNYKEIDSDSFDDVFNVDNSNQRSNRNKTKFNKPFKVISNLKSNIQTPKTVFTDIIQNKKNTNMDKNPRTKRSKSNKQTISESSISDTDKKRIIEPIYCICEEISYGNMICCDNDLCPIEWFHFGCVTINRKPKGIWYCPKCRGTNSKVMKPRKLFFKELEEYNKRKEGC